MKSFYLICLLILNGSILMIAQDRVGIGTTTPERRLDITGGGTTSLRVRSTINFGSRVGLELVRGSLASNAKDWRLLNDTGQFKIESSNDHFNLKQTQFIIDYQGEVGLGTENPHASLHVIGGEEATNTLDGVMMLGSKTNLNFVSDANELNARNNGNASQLFLQSSGGNIQFHKSSNSDVFLAGGLGSVNVGSNIGLAKLNSTSDDFQFSLRNLDGPNPTNEWRIGASNTSWAVGSNQLIFSPTNSSSDSKFRLVGTDENSGVYAPIMINSGGTMLIDDNEIDTKFGSLFINQHSQQDTYINPTGGNVSIGTSSSAARLHIDAGSSELPLVMKYQDFDWGLKSNSSTDLFEFQKNGSTLSFVHDVTGLYFAISDRRLKENIEKSNPMLDKLNDLNVYSYNFKGQGAENKSIGMMAQEVIEIFPELVTSENDQYTLSYAQFSVIATKALQEQSKQIDALENELEELMALKNKK